MVLGYRSLMESSTFSRSFSQSAKRPLSMMEMRVQLPVIAVGKAHHAVLELGHGVLPGVLAEGGVKRVQQELRAGPPPPFGQQAGQGDLHDSVIVLDVNALHQGGGREVFLLLNVGGGVEDVQAICSARRAASVDSVS